MIVSLFVFTRDMKKDSDGNFRFGIDLALVFSHVPKLGVANLQGPCVWLGAV